MSGGNGGEGRLRQEFRWMPSFQFRVDFPRIDAELIRPERSPERAFRGATKGVNDTSLHKADAQIGEQGRNVMGRRPSVLKLIEPSPKLKNRGGLIHFTAELSSLPDDFHHLWKVFFKSGVWVFAEPFRGQSFGTNSRNRSAVNFHGNPQK